MSRPLALAEWYQRHGQAIPNGDGPLVPGDEVGVLEPWSPPDPFDGLSTSSARIALQTIQNGFDDGQRYTLKKSRGTKRWAGDVVIDAGADVSEVSAKAILKTWVQRGMIFEDQVRNPKTRKEENGLFVNMDLMPRTVQMRQVSKRQLERAGAQMSALQLSRPLTLKRTRTKCLKRTWGAALALFQGCGTGVGGEVEV